MFFCKFILNFEYINIQKNEYNIEYINVFNKLNILNQLKHYFVLLNLLLFFLLLLHSLFAFINLIYDYFLKE